MLDSQALIVPLPALEAKSALLSGATQQVADCPVPTESSRTTVPDALSLNDASALLPALAMTRCPAWSKAIANGTVPGSGFTTGLIDRRPPECTPNTSMSLPVALVVTISSVHIGRGACRGRE